MAKLTRERALQERRALKQEKKEQRKQAAAAERDGEAADPAVSRELVDDETPGG